MLGMTVFLPGKTGKAHITNTGSTGFDGKLVIPNTVRNPSGVNRKCFVTGMLRFAQHDNAISR